MLQPRQPRIDWAGLRAHLKAAAKFWSTERSPTAKNHYTNLRRILERELYWNRGEVAAVLIDDCLMCEPLMTDEHVEELNQWLGSVLKVLLGPPTGNSKCQIVMFERERHSGAA